MTFQQLEYILEVNRTGSVSRAAENLYISRSSVSSSISSLEAELGYPIFNRTLNGLTPSKKGRIILEYAERICQTHQLMTNLGQTNEGRSVSIGITDFPPVTEAAAALMQEYRDRDDVRFSFGVYHLNEIIDKLFISEIEVAVFCRLGNLHLNIETALERKGLQWKVMGHVPTVLTIGVNHPLYRQENVSLRDFDGDIFLDTLEKEISRNGYLRSALKINPRKILSCNNGSLRYTLLQKGIGFTVGKIPPTHIIEHFQLRCIPIPELSQPLFCAANPNRPLSSETQLFLELLEKKLEAYYKQ